MADKDKDNKKDNKETPKKEQEGPNHPSNRYVAVPFHLRNKEKTK